MREVAFIKKNKDNWLKIEDLLYDQIIQPEKLAKAFDQLNNDLSFAQTYYPKSKLVIYLNSLTQEIYHKIYKPKKDWLGILNFFTEDIPLISYRYRYYLYFSILFFIGCLALGAMSMHYDQNFFRSLVGDSYVDRTIESIKNGDPTAVYNTDALQESGLSSLQITLNNLWVGLQAFFYGILAGIGTLYIVFMNGVMIGAFLQMFENYGVFWQAMRSVWIHGAMELFTITVECAAGLLLGFSFLFPGSLTRKKSFLLKGKQAVKLVISTFPFTISAGFLEGFVTQYGDDMPLALDLFIIFSTLGVITYYYLIYPLAVNKSRAVKNYEFNEWIDEV